MQYMIVVLSNSGSVHTYGPYESCDEAWKKAKAYRVGKEHACRVLVANHIHKDIF